LSERSERWQPPPPEPRWAQDVDHGRVLVFAPHPDDETAGPGGALCLHRRAGDPVRVVVATDGIAGDPDGRFDRSTYAQRRRAESRAGLRELGVDDAVYWGFPDSCQLSASDIELGVLKAIEAITAARPDIVYLPWELEGHPDHHALHRIVVGALERTRFAGLALGYEVWHAMIPDLIVDITPVIEHKRAAMLCHRSQIDYVRFDHCMLGLNAYRSLIHARGQGYGEAFRIVCDGRAAPPLTGTGGGS
jgi:LmbE family N-acetylglucosaminyl deacetylase